MARLRHRNASDRVFHESKKPSASVNVISQKATETGIQWAHVDHGRYTIVGAAVTAIWEVYPCWGRCYCHLGSILLLEPVLIPFGRYPLVGASVTAIWEVYPCCSRCYYHLGGILLLGSLYCHLGGIPLLMPLLLPFVNINVISQEATGTGIQWAHVDHGRYTFVGAAVITIYGH